MTPLAEIIRAEIRDRGDLPFARFMELALYHPAHGYYEQDRRQVGRSGDFYTSVSVGPLFGELLAFRFAGWLERLPGPVALFEAGAHDGRLAADILGWLRGQRPELFARLQYILLEPSPRRRAWQAERLRDFSEVVRWRNGPDELHASPVSGIGFSNELLDAFPVRRFGWDAAARAWFEWGVTWAGERFAWVRMPGRPAQPPVPVPEALAAVLPEGYCLEASPAALAWWDSAARALGQGWLVAVDYGLTADEVISPARVAGTLRSYSKHRVGGDLLADPGGQDLTAHVHFSEVQQAGEAAGLSTVELITQPRWLTRIMAESQADARFGPWDSGRVRQFQTLTHPEHLGRAFRVLVQGRGVF
jgi:SAM-dependent MidA family methyltransferase